MLLRILMWMLILFNSSQMHMIKVIYTLICLFFAVNIHAQISGTVTDAQGEPLIGAVVMVKGTTIGTVTQGDGTYSIEATQGTLVFSYTGYDAVEIPIGDNFTIDAVLEVSNISLNDVVVIGYGTQRKADVTTAVVTVGEETIKNRPMVSAAEALQGTAAGVQVVQPSGKPGGDIAVRVRGSTSVLAGNENSKLYRCLHPKMLNSPLLGI